jgi:hypothetical protein
MLLFPDGVHRLCHPPHDVKAIEHRLALASGNPSRVARMYGSHMSIATALMAVRCSSVNDVYYAAKLAVSRSSATNSTVDRSKSQTMV